MKLRPFFLALGALAASQACAGKPAGPPPGFEDVLLEGEVTHDALTAFARALQINPVIHGGPGLKITWPADGEKIPVEQGDIASFCWTFTSFSLGPRRSVPPALDARWAALPGPAPEARSHRWIGPLAELLGPVRAAHADEEPGYEGVVVWAVFSTPDDPALVRVLTSALDYAPAPAVWKKMAAATQPITLRLFTGVVEDGRSMAEGPYVGTEMSFTIVP